MNRLPTPTGELARDRIGRMASAALHFAAIQSALPLPFPDSTRVGLVLANAQAGQGGMIRFAEEVRTQSPRFVSPIHFPETVGNYLAGALARAHGLRGPNVTVSTAGQAGIEAFAEAAEMIHHHTLDMVFVGVCETWASAMVENTGADHPVVAEGACFFVMEREESAAARVAEVLTKLKWAPVTSERDARPLIRVAASGTSRRAICIEPWLGYLPSAGPAFGIAAAIAAAAGMSVPLCTGMDPFAAELTSISPQERGLPTYAQVTVEPHTDGEMALHLLIPPRQTARKSDAAS